MPMRYLIPQIAIKNRPKRAVGHSALSSAQARYAEHCDEKNQTDQRPFTQRRHWCCSGRSVSVALHVESKDCVVAHCAVGYRQANSDGGGIRTCVTVVGGVCECAGCWIDGQLAMYRWRHRLKDRPGRHLTSCSSVPGDRCVHLGCVTRIVDHWRCWRYTIHRDGGCSFCALRNYGLGADLVFKRV